MTTEDKLRIISTWTYQFVMCETTGGKHYAQIIFHDRAFNEETDTHWQWSYDDAVSEAYRVVSELIHLKVNRIERE